MNGSMQINFNLIEVLPSGTCFNIRKKTFYKVEELRASPRAFVRYHYNENVIPKPIKFIEGIDFFSILFSMQFNRFWNFVMLELLVF